MSILVVLRAKDKKNLVSYGSVIVGQRRQEWGYPLNQKRMETGPLSAVSRKLTAFTYLSGLGNE